MAEYRCTATTIGVAHRLGTRESEEEVEEEEEGGGEAS